MKLLHTREVYRLWRCITLFGYGLFDFLCKVCTSIKNISWYQFLGMFIFCAVAMVIPSYINTILFELFIVYTTFTNTSYKNFNYAKYFTARILFIFLQYNIDRLCDMVVYVGVLFESVCVCYNVFELYFVYASRSFPDRVGYFADHFEYYAGYGILYTMSSYSLTFIQPLLLYCMLRYDSDKSEHYLKRLPPAQKDEMSLFDIIEKVGERVMVCTVGYIATRVSKYF